MKTTKISILCIFYLISACTSFRYIPEENKHSKTHTAEVFNSDSIKMELNVVMSFYTEIQDTIFSDIEIFIQVNNNTKSHIVIPVKDIKVSMFGFKKKTKIVQGYLKTLEDTWNIPSYKKDTCEKFVYSLHIPKSNKYWFGRHGIDINIPYIQIDNILYPLQNNRFIARRCY